MEVAMRSELISGAMSQVPNRYLLAKLLAKATRGFHRPGSRIQDTTNDVLLRFSRSNPIADVQPAQLLSNPPRGNRSDRKIEHSSKLLALPRVATHSKASLEAIRVLGI
jgi:hypothetical protein